MADHTLTAPAEYVDDFRAALMAEITWSAGVAEEHREAGEREDLRCAIRLLEEDASLLSQLESQHPDDPRAPVELAADDHIEALEHACATMASKIIGPKLEDEVGYSPMDERQAGRVRTQIARLSWAVDRAAEMCAAAAAQREGGA